MSDRKAGMRDWVAHLRSWSVLCSLLSVGTLLGTRQRPCEREREWPATRPCSLTWPALASQSADHASSPPRFGTDQIKIRYEIQSIFFWIFPRRIK